MGNNNEKRTGIGYSIRAFFRYMYLPMAIFYLEMVLKIHCFDEIPYKNAMYTLLFSFSLGFFIQIVAMMFNRKACKVITALTILIATLIIGTQLVYFEIFKTFTSVSMVSMAGEAISNYWRELLSGIGRSAVSIGLLLLPFVIYLIFGNFLTYKKGYGVKAGLVLLMVPLLITGANLALIHFDNNGGISYKYIYSNTFSPIEAGSRFGILTTLRLDIENLISPKTDEIGGEVNLGDLSGEGNGEGSGIGAVTYEDNVMEIDFNSLIANETNSGLKDMHEYFSQLTPTEKNQYTGMFEGYNLIWICAEGFSSWALHPEKTPTLYKMANEGFVFNNFYNPIWYKSTTDGEYTTLIGLVPDSGKRSFTATADNYMPFGFGNLFSDLGYTTKAYHNHTFEYYGRDLSHPNLGYDYKALGNGLNVTRSWPESDLEMMELSIPEYINEEKFHTYYMTVSGHLEYNFAGNAMCRKHKADVEDLPYSDACKAYIACNMEFDQAMEYLIDQLAQAGKLDNTVIVFSGDHYPYGLTHEQIEELHGGEVDKTFDLYKSTFVIWNNKMETVQVDKYVSTLDILPTLLNLFGFEYDSRLFVGSDMLSTAPALVMFNDKSYITDYGRYSASSNKFTPNEGITVPDTYMQDVLNVVKAKFYYSIEILDNDYYGVLFKE